MVLRGWAKDHSSVAAVIGFPPDAKADEPPDPAPITLNKEPCLSY